MTSIEADPELEPVLRTHALEHEGFRYIMGDALKVDPARIAEVTDGEPTVLAANLPYNVATPLVLDLLAGVPAISRMLVARFDGAAAVWASAEIASKSSERG